MSMKLQNIGSRYRTYLLGMALVLSSIAISIRSNDGEINLVLHNYPGLIFFMVVVSSFLVAIYLQMNRREMSSLSNQIREQSNIKPEGIDAALNELTERQRVVYDLIVSGKTNKEIMTMLFIEQSTLKSHINQIYRKLNVKSRRELKSKINP
jgi:DNA-binding NarL/FixJ family response regulator